eukprot:3948320-Amphidinium_carterae.2
MLFYVPDWLWWVTLVVALTVVGRCYLGLGAGVESLGGEVGGDVIGPTPLPPSGLPGTATFEIRSFAARGLDTLPAANAYGFSTVSTLAGGGVTPDRTGIRVSEGTGHSRGLWCVWNSRYGREVLGMLDQLQIRTSETPKLGTSICGPSLVSRNCADDWARFAGFSYPIAVQSSKVAYTAG